MGEYCTKMRASVRYACEISRPTLSDSSEKLLILIDNFNIRYCILVSVDVFMHGIFAIISTAFNFDRIFLVKVQM